MKEEEIDIAESSYPYINRDISWLSFNYRVLQEAKDTRVPLFERVKFLAIYSSNLGEFFKVRIANLRNVMRAGKKSRKKIDYKASDVLKQILGIINEQLLEFSSIFDYQIIPALRENNINILKRTQLNEDQTLFIDDFFRENLLPFVQPVLLVKHKVKPFLQNGALYLALHMTTKDDILAKPQYAIVKIPSDHVPRFIEIPAERAGSHDIIMLDDIVRHSISSIFPGFDIIDSFSIKLTRDAELYLDDEFAGDLINKIEKSLKKRNVGVASRMVFDREIPSHLLEYLKAVFELSRYDLLQEGRYHNNFDFFDFPTFGKKELLNKSLHPIAHKTLESAASIFDEIDKQDHILHVPYHSFNSVIKFFEDAAIDPSVTDIKIIQYRVGSRSNIMKALMRAVNNGIRVSSFIEIKARFDEEANLRWGETLEKAGVTVNYSLPGLKVHSKMAIVIRKVNNAPKVYCYLGTGNFHEKTAKIYSDIGLFTANQELGQECLSLYNYLETKEKPRAAFKHLAVGQFNLLDVLISLVKQEIDNAQRGKKAEIILKMNSLQEKDMINLLYEASQAGVQVKLIIRGICSLVPGVEGVSDNIEAISIVDRYLEHARIFIFHADGERKIFCSSADWMYRNLHNRIETVFPIYDQTCKKTILELIDLQLMDNVKARILDQHSLNEYKQPSTDEVDLQSQVETYYYIKRITE